MKSGRKDLEQYDWFDIHDHKRGNGSTREGRRRGFFTRSVHIFLIDSRGRILICQRPSSKKTYPSQWTSSAGGHVEKSESYRDAAHRELREELAIRTTLVDAGRFDVVNEHEAAIHHLYVGVLPLGAHITEDASEISRMRFLSLERLWKEAQAHPHRYAPPFLGALYQYVLWKNGPTYVLDFDHTLFDWYRFKQDLQKNLTEKHQISSSIFAKAKSIQESKSIYNIHAHVREIAKLSATKRLATDTKVFFATLPKYLYPDARTLLRRISKKKCERILLTYGDRANQKFFIRGTGILGYFASIIYTSKKGGKVPALKKLLAKPRAVIFVNDDPEETVLIVRELPLVRRIFLVERPDAKFKKIAPNALYLVVRDLRATLD